MANRDLEEYWTNMPPGTREERRTRVREAELEEVAQEREMLVLDGKLIKPEEWPCACEKESPYHCFDQLEDCALAWEMENYMDKHNKMCTCPCHTYWEPD